jgi:hypothetical protein
MFRNNFHDDNHENNIISLVEKATNQIHQNETNKQYSKTTLLLLEND